MKVTGFSPPNCTLIVVGRRKRWFASIRSETNCARRKRIALRNELRAANEVTNRDRERVRSPGRPSDTRAAQDTRACGGKACGREGAARARSAMRGWRRWRKQGVDALLAGPYGSEARDLVAFLDAMTLEEGSPELIKRAGAWRALTPSALVQILRLIDRTSPALREKHGLAPLSTMSLPGEPPTAFEIIREMLRMKTPSVGTRCADCDVGTITLGEWYMVKNDVWEQAWPGRRKSWCRREQGQSPRVGCLEDRIGPTLMRIDFTDAPINNPNIAGTSARLRDRLIYRPRHLQRARRSREVDPGAMIREVLDAYARASARRSKTVTRRSAPARSGNARAASTGSRWKATRPMASRAIPIMSTAGAQPGAARPSRIISGSRPCAAPFGDELLYAGDQQQTLASEFLSATPDGLLIGLPRDALAALGVAGHWQPRRARGRVQDRRPAHQARARQSPSTSTRRKCNSACCASSHRTVRTLR